MAYALGLICYGLHESAAVLVDGGTVIAAAEEERFSRRKFDNGFPVQAAQFCLRQAGISGRDLAAVGFGFDPRRRLAAKARHLLRYLPASTHLLRTRGPMQEKMWSVAAEVRRQLGFTGPVRRLNHHLCHAASAFLPSPFPRASVLTIDGVGDWEACWIGLGDGLSLKPIATIDWPLSLGHIYSAFTEYLGFQSFSDEYRVMGLAPYGDPRPFARAMSDVFRPTGTGYDVDLAYFDFPVGRVPRFGRRLVDTFGPPLPAGSEIPTRYRDIAAALQAQLEAVVESLVRQAITVTGVGEVCLAGGVALNCVVNGRLVASRVVQDLFVPPCASDSGAALGAAYLAHLATTGGLARATLDSALLGPQYDAAQIERVLVARKVEWVRVEDPSATAAELLYRGKVIGWYQGRMEFGHRALGARSILADPRRADMKDVINAKVKYRELFRPFAPSVLEERVQDFFCTNRRLPFMTETCRVSADQAARIPAVVHVDGTARVQTVSRATQPEYWALIRRFEQLSGVPVVLNTSFNIKGQPIVNTPDEAVMTFLATQLDALICGPFLIRKARGVAGEDAATSAAAAAMVGPQNHAGEPSVV